MLSAVVCSSLTEKRGRQEKYSTDLCIFCIKEQLIWPSMPSPAKPPRADRQGKFGNFSSAQISTILDSAVPNDTMYLDRETW